MKKLFNEFCATGKAIAVNVTPATMVLVPVAMVAGAVGGVGFAMGAAGISTGFSMVASLSAGAISAVPAVMVGKRIANWAIKLEQNV
jgi:hypothetical protein